MKTNSWFSEIEGTWIYLRRPVLQPQNPYKGKWSGESRPWVYSSVSRGHYSCVQMLNQSHNARNINYNNYSCCRSSWT
jgi:hypothetical protein